MQTATRHRKASRLSCGTFRTLDYNFRIDVLRLQAPCVSSASLSLGGRSPLVRLQDRSSCVHDVTHWKTPPLTACLRRHSAIVPAMGEGISLIWWMPQTGNGQQPRCSVSRAEERSTDRRSPPAIYGAGHAVAIVRAASVWRRGNSGRCVRLVRRGGLRCPARCPAAVRDRPPGRSPDGGRAEGRGYGGAPRRRLIPMSAIRQGQPRTQPRRQRPRMTAAA